MYDVHSIMVFFDPHAPLRPQNIYCLSIFRDALPPSLWTSYMEAPLLSLSQARSLKLRPRSSVFSITIAAAASKIGGKFARGEWK